MRNARTSRYVVAGVITLGIFLLGLMFGLVLESKRVNYVQDVLQEQRAEFASSQVQYAYIDSLGADNTSCPVVYSVFDHNLENLDRAAKRLEEYVEQSRINDDSFEIIKRQYTIEQVRYWLLSEKAKEACGEDLVRILYFFSTAKDCPDCGEQGFVLDYLKDVYGQKVLIFSIDANFEEEPLVGILKQQFDVTEFPTLIIDDQVFEGFQSRQELEELLCQKFDKPVPECV